MVVKIRNYLTLCQYAIGRAFECLRSERYRECEVWLSRARISANEVDFMLPAVEYMLRKES